MGGPLARQISVSGQEEIQERARSYMVRCRAGTIDLKLGTNASLLNGVLENRLGPIQFSLCVSGVRLILHSFFRLVHVTFAEKFLFPRPLSWHSHGGAANVAETDKEYFCSGHDWRMKGLDNEMIAAEQ